MQLTPNYRLRKPDGTDPVDVQDLNDNMDVLDAEVVKKLDKTGDASNVVNKFSQAGTRTNLSSGEKLSLSLGKIVKWFADLKSVAFSGKYSDLTERPTIPSGGIADKSKIIDNLDDIAANTQAGYMAGALALKEVNSDLGGLEFKEDSSGKYVRGADSVWVPLGEAACDVICNTGKMAQTLQCTAAQKIRDGLVILFDNNLGVAPSITLSSGTYELISNYSIKSTYLNGYVYQYIYRIHDVPVGGIITASGSSASAHFALQVISL